MDTAPKPLSIGQSMSLRARRSMLIIGLGFVAAVLGSIISAPLAPRLQPRMLEAPMLVRMIAAAVVPQIWVLAVLPGIGFVVGNVLKLRPASLAFGAAITGELFFAALDVVTAGVSSLWADPGALALRIGTLAGGILLTMRATRAGVQSSERATAAARSAAEAKKAEYDAILRESERIANKGEATTTPGDPAPTSVTGAPADPALTVGTAAPADAGATGPAAAAGDAVPTSDAAQTSAAATTSDAAQTSTAAGTSNAAPTADPAPTGSAAPPLKAADQG